MYIHIDWPVLNTDWSWRDRFIRTILSWMTPVSVSHLGMLRPHWYALLLVVSVNCDWIGTPLLPVVNVIIQCSILFSTLLFWADLRKTFTNWWGTIAVTFLQKSIKCNKAKQKIIKKGKKRKENTSEGFVQWGTLRWALHISMYELSIKKKAVGVAFSFFSKYSKVCYRLVFPRHVWCKHLIRVNHVQPLYYFKPIWCYKCHVRHLRNFSLIFYFFSFVLLF